MKKSLVRWILPMAACLLFITVQGCKQSDKNKEQAQADQHDDAHDHDAGTNDEAHDHESSGEHSLVLNNGAKWAADEPTNKNANTIIALGDQFLKNGESTLKDYQTLGVGVNEAIDTMIRECTMKGEADQALHVWFLPILKHANTLKTATETAGLDEVSHEMIDRMKMYHDYFE